MVCVEISFAKYRSLFYIIKHIHDIVNINLRTYGALSMILLIFGAVFTMWSISYTGYTNAFLDKLGSILMVMGATTLGITVGFQGRNKSSVESNTNKK